jgi:hypothetical protein
MSREAARSKMLPWGLLIPGSDGSAEDLGRRGHQMAGIKLY